ncbi:MAG: hypothetical protein IPL15_23595 [Comamonadaceae bacterium]|uniref:hypothetical protein n=1 Tax=Candidatus Skiveiella danica TaxID=3386177 RepID=UPI00390B612C|nr:hypothetical protein [Comamonadaceae bacterium]
MAAAAQCAAPTPKRYQRRRPERTLWYRIVQTHLETWLELASGEDGEAPPAHVEANLPPLSRMRHPCFTDSLAPTATSASTIS